MLDKRVDELEQKIEKLIRFIGDNLISTNNSFATFFSPELV
jgi:hypothetical protein